MLVYRYFSLSVVLAISASVFITCGKDSPTEPAQQIPTRITLSANSLSLNAIGESVSLIATVLDQNDRVIRGAGVTWTSSETNVATVTDNGQVTAVKNGSARITATAGNASASANITVVQTAVRVVITPDSASLTSIGENLQLEVASFDERNRAISDAAFTWSSSNPAVATVDSTGLVTAVANGTATITASAGDVSMDIEVAVSPVVEISLSPTTPFLTSLGETLQMIAAPLDENGEPVRGASGAAEASVTVTVSQVAAGISITPNIRELSEGQTLQLTARVVDANDHELRGIRVTWSSSKREVATVSRTGLVRAIAIGSTRITATGGDLFITITLRVVTGYGSGITVDVPGSLESDREGLVALYNALDGTNWATSTNWLTDEPLNTWAGVRFYTNLDRVALIDLQNMGLNGSLPSDISKIGGLAYLRLSGNPDLTGSIPTSIGQLGFLRWIHLINTSILGPLPSTLSQLEDLEQLFVRSDDLTGTIPAGLTGLKKLKDIEISGGSLTGTIPSGFGNMSQLRQLSLSCGLTGSIPTSLGQLRQLEQLALARNALTGNIPAALGQVTSLRSIFVENNANMSGTLPHALTNLSNLDLLSATGTQLCRPSDEAFTTWYESRIPVHRRDQVTVCP